MSGGVSSERFEADGWFANKLGNTRVKKGAGAKTFDPCTYLHRLSPETGELNEIAKREKLAGRVSMK